jgi:hypothetical protein
MSIDRPPRSGATTRGIHVEWFSLELASGGALTATQLTWGGWQIKFPPFLDRSEETLSKCDFDEARRGAEGIAALVDEYTRLADELRQDYANDLAGIAGVRP